MRLTLSSFFLLYLNVICCAQQAASQQADSLYQQGNFAEAAEAYHWLSENTSEKDSSYLYQYWEAKCLIQQYEYEQARPLLQDIIAEIASENHSPLLSKVYHELAYTYMGEGALQQAQKFSQKSIDTEIGSLKIDTFQLAKYYELKGFISMQTGAYTEAEHWVKEAHQLRQDFLDPVDKELGYSANTLYIVLSALGNLKEAEIAIAQAWTILQNHLPEEHPHIAVIANNYSTHLMDMGDPLQAREFLLKAIVSNRKGERHLLLAQNYVNLGLLFLNLNESKTAESYYQQAWEIADTLISYPDYQRANIKDALGAVYYQEDRLDKADSMFRSALAEKRELYEEDSEEIAQSLFNLGLIAEEKEAWQLADGYFSKAEIARKHVFGLRHPKRADVLFELGNIAWERGQKEKSIQNWNLSLAIYQEKFGLTHHHAQENLIRLAEAYAQLSSSDSLQLTLKKAWAGICGLNTALSTYEQLDSLSIQMYYPEILDLLNFQLGLLLQQKHSLNSQEQHTARRIFSMVQDWLPSFQSLYNDASLHEGITEQLHSFYKHYAILAYGVLNENSRPDEDWQDLLLYCIQASRGATIQAAFQDRQAIQFAGIPDTLLAEAQALKQQLRYSLARQEEIEEGEESSEISLQQQTILQKWQELQQQIKQSYPQYYEARYAIQPLTIKEVQRKLTDPQSRILAYFDLDTALLAVQLDQKKLNTHWLSVPGSWQDSLYLFQHAFQQQTNANAAYLGHYLYQLLWEELEIPAQSTVKILADGPLHYLNFETLISSQVRESQSMAEWPWLIKDYNIYYGHSLTSEKDTTPLSGKVVGIAPGFSQDLKENYLKKLEANEKADSTFMNWLRTPWSLAFVQHIQDAGWGEAITEENATERHLLNQASKASILHFGTHARFQNDIPLNSFLALTPAPQHHEDGYLFAYELYGKVLDTQLAVLTACETGLGQYRKGEGVLSLAHAFRYAGCPSVIYSLWSIDDQESNQLINDFYENLNDDRTVAEALRAAKLHYLSQADGALQSPYYWGSLLLTGDNPTIKIRTVNYAGWLAGATLALFCLALMGWLFQRRKAK